ncbi:alkaline phosphatase family protein [Piscinibacter sp. XHJ-5]|uniref:alkaline phosphatase family protein n=1 Tax=Piscinibacter sp. XHJ-5 TaxID=3037797 RepID=UPI0024530BF3|nr:alkaline phosphatase family protein [Piscinibacter sp. XHJ-5]
MTYTIVHPHIGRALDVRVTRVGNIATVRCAASGTFDVRFPGQLRKFAKATFNVRVFVEPVAPVDAPQPPPGRWETEQRPMPVTLSIFTPDGQPFTADQVTLADLLRFRDPRGVRHGLWSFTVEGRSEPLEEDPEEFKVVNGTGRVGITIDETVTSKSAPPLVTDTIDAATLRRYTFDLHRVGAFTASARTIGSPLPTGDARELRLIDPDGVRVASGRGRVRFDVGLPTLAKSRDAQGRPRLWTLEVLPSLSPSPLRPRSAINATVVASARVRVQNLQARIDRMIGPRGSKLQLFGETQGKEALARLRILDTESAETIDMHGLLDGVIDSVAQDPGVDKDIRAGVAYTLARESRDLGHGFELSLSGVKVGTIDLAVGASQKIQPAVPALKVGLQVDGEATVQFHGFPLATVKVRGGHIDLEAGMAFEPGVGFVARTWMNDDLVDVDLHWAAALAAGVLTGGLILLGAEGAAEAIESGINSMLPRMLQRVVTQAVGRTPQILAMMLGDDFTYRALRLEGNDIVFEHDAPLEHEPRPDPDYTPIIGRSATQLGPGAWRITPPTLGDTWAAGNLAKIDHVVVVMMENRSYDHVLGYRAELAGTAASDGMTTALRDFLKQQGFPAQALSGVDRIAPNAAGLRTAFPRAVGHELKDVAEQLSARLAAPGGRTINSPKGFVENFRSRAGTLLPEDVLGFYEAADLPFSAFLAQHYGFSDRYFCSHPGPTLPNRMLSLTGDVQHDRTGAPILDNNDSDNFSLSRATTVYDLLTRFGVSWRIYESFPSVTMLRMFARYATNDTDIRDISHLAADAAAGNLPALTVVEPAMHHFPQNDDHSSNNTPAVDMYRGQHFLQSVYEALRANPEMWKKTLLLITYDEHGGFYDHVVPPLAEARSRPPVVDGIGTSTSRAFEVPATVATRYGVRVPTFVVSPWVPAGKGPDTVLDHCSIVKTVLARFCPGRPFLSDRVHASRSFDAFLSATTPRLSVPRPPALKPLPLALAGPARIVTPPISRKQMRAGPVGYHELTGMLARLLGR